MSVRAQNMGEPALEAAIGELAVVEDAAALTVLAVNVLVEAAPRGIPPVAVAALETLAHVVLNVVEERLRR